MDFTILCFIHLNAVCSNMFCVWLQFKKLPDWSANFLLSGAGSFKINVVDCGCP